MKVTLACGPAFAARLRIPGEVGAAVLRTAIFTRHVVQEVIGNLSKVKIRLAVLKVVNTYVGGNLELLD